MNTQRVNLSSGLAAILAGVAFYLLTLNMPDGPAGFPRLIAAGLGICGFILAARALFAHAAMDEIRAIDFSNAGKTVAALCFWLLLLFAAGYLGFAVPGVIFLAVLSWFLLGRPRDFKKLLRIALFSALMTAALVMIFVNLLGVSPPGPFGF